MKKYHKDYEKNGKELRYVGDIYVLPQKTVKRRIVLKNFLFCILYLLLIILAGLVNNIGSRNPFIALPYAFLFLPYAYMVMGSFSSLQLKERMERPAYDRSVGRIFRSCVGILCISLYLVPADIILLFLTEEKKTVRAVDEAVFLCACAAVLAVSFLQMCDLQKWKKKVMLWKHEEEVPIGK